jgi:RNA polymerase sigma-70 factor (ECF subfamily)
MQEAFAVALESWSRSGIPDNPRPCLISTARFKAIDVIRRRARVDEAQRDPVAHMESRVSDDPDAGDEEIRETPIPSEVAAPQELPERLDAVLHVVYLVFNEGYSAAAGAEVTRAELTGEAIRLGRLLTELQTEPEAIGLLALMLLQESRRAARTSPAGELILLENQDRALWNREQIAEGTGLVEKALKSRRFGPYTLQAAIAALHAAAESPAATDWRQIVELYELWR